jgi:alpha-glucoside transport system substrate-binding protein
MAGNVYTAFHDRAEVQALATFLTTGESVRPLIEAGYLAPHKDASMDWYPSDPDRNIAEIFHSGDVYRQDASDLMPPEVGAGSFWAGMVDLISGFKFIPQVLADIDASWPQ